MDVRHWRYFDNPIWGCNQIKYMTTGDLDVTIKSHFRFVKRPSDEISQCPRSLKPPMLNTLGIDAT
jgi:hypothetical protein